MGKRLKLFSNMMNRFTVLIFTKVACHNRITITGNHRDQMQFSLIFTHFTQCKLQSLLTEIRLSQIYRYQYFLKHKHILYLASAEAKLKFRRPRYSSLLTTEAKLCCPPVIRYHRPESKINRVLLQSLYKSLKQPEAQTLPDDGDAASTQSESEDPGPEYRSVHVVADQPEPEHL